MVTFFDIAVIIAIASACAGMWRAGGNGHSLVRNPGVPSVIGFFRFLASYNWISLLYIPITWAAIRAFSYGVNAPIHKFWVWLFKKGDDGNYMPVEIATRATCGLFWALPSAVFSYISHAWIAYIIYVIFFTIVNGIQPLIKDVEVSERMVGACLSLNSVLLLK